MLYIYEDGSPQYIKISGRNRVHILVSNIYPELKEATNTLNYIFSDYPWDSPDGYATICILSLEKISELENSAIDIKDVNFDTLDTNLHINSILKNEWFKSYEEKPWWWSGYTFYPYSYWTYSERLQFRLGKRRKLII